MYPILLQPPATVVSLSLTIKALACTVALEFTAEEATCSPKLSFLQLAC